MSNNNRAGDSGTLVFGHNDVSVKEWKTAGIQTKNELRYVEIDCVFAYPVDDFHQKIIGSHGPAWFTKGSDVAFVGRWIVVEASELGDNLYRISLKSVGRIAGSGVNED